MTILSNHRVHTYKASATRIRRDISPKKVPVLKTTYTKKNQTITPKMLANLMLILKSSPQIAAPLMRPEPSAPLAVMTTRTISVWNHEYTVEIPDGYDIYEGLRRWYPSLYEAAMEEEKYERSLITMEEGLTEEDIEQAWAHQDYLEWLCD